MVSFKRFSEFLRYAQNLLKLCFKSHLLDIILVSLKEIGFPEKYSFI